MTRQLHDGQLHVGDRVTIVRSRDKPLLGLEAVVTHGLAKRVRELSPYSYVIELDDGVSYHSPPEALAGPIVAGYHASPGRWADCVWRPKGARSRRCRRR